MTIQDLRDTLKEEIRKRDILHETTLANRQILKEKCDGTFEAVVIGNGDEKCLIPQVGTLHFLYRGQNEEVIPCVPSLYRGNPTEVEIFIERMRLTVFSRLLDSHPVVTHFFHKHHFFVDYEGLAQHYGLKTSVLDLTSSLDVALFFATCRYDGSNDMYHPFDDDKEHDAILYVFLPILDNEPSPSFNGKCLNDNIKPIGLQAFPRPGLQEGYGLHLPNGRSVKCYMYRFSFDCDDSRYYHRLCIEKVDTDKDCLIQKAKDIKRQTEFSFSVFEETFKRYRPKGYSGNKMKNGLKRFVTLGKHVKDVLFTAEEIQEIKSDWNSVTGPAMASKIYRKCWFEHDGVRNSHDFRTLQRINHLMLLYLIASPDALHGAEWINYENKPTGKHVPRDSDGKWERIPSSFESMYGDPYLTEKDWIIN